MKVGFWKKWKEAGELERESLVRNLPFVQGIDDYLKAFKGKDALLRFSIASQINSFFCDLEEFLEAKPE